LFFIFINIYSFLIYFIKHVKQLFCTQSNFLLFMVEENVYKFIFVM